MPKHRVEASATLMKRCLMVFTSLRRALMPPFQMYLRQSGTPGGSIDGAQRAHVSD